ncbi:hypothetical protein HPB51_029495 [Rhipicephalus microplus]|uniref:Uncharacterized protein n=1 Tax=Rhipicephalus microplus TaxID=6941 RepID=A0A9J6CUN8_RHIMP|nr:hypothetical protein HPB51_029495 [Rhipicephalus microplus]
MELPTYDCAWTAQTQHVVIRRSRIAGRPPELDFDTDKKHLAPASKDLYQYLIAKNSLECVNDVILHRRAFEALGARHITPKFGRLANLMTVDSVDVPRVPFDLTSIIRQVVREELDRCEAASVLSPRSLNRETAVPFILPPAIAAYRVSAPSASKVTSMPTSPDYALSAVACKPHQGTDHALSIGATITMVAKPTGLLPLIAGRPINRITTVTRQLQCEAWRRHLHGSTGLISTVTSELFTAGKLGGATHGSEAAGHL